MLKPWIALLIRKLSLLDQKIRLGIDRILPKNLTFRYIVALTAVAALAIFGQMMIQSSLVQQMQDQHKLRFLEQLVRDSENLRKSALSLQLSSKRSQIKIQIELVEALAFQLPKDTSILENAGISPETRLIFTLDPFYKELNSALKRVETSLKNIALIIQDLSSVTKTRTPESVDEIALKLLDNETIYRTSLVEISKYYNRHLENKIFQFKRTESILLVLTLLILIIEALYVFRPGVESLYEALRTRSDFLGRMGHEMRNPMNSIIGMTNLLIETPLTDQQKKYLNILQKSSSGLLDVLNNLLDFSHIEAGTIKLERIQFDLYKLLERSIDLTVFGAHAQGIELILDLDPNIPFQLLGDPTRLQQILSNLLGNAVKFTKKGEVILKVQLQRETSHEAWIQFSVIDTGVGIDDDKKEKIFDAFVQEDSTVRRKFGGTGLGLSISRDLVHIMGGTLSVESQKSKGSRFYFTIPFNIPSQATKLSVGISILNFNFDKYDARIFEPNFSVSDSISKLIIMSGGKTLRIQNRDELQNITHSIESHDNIRIAPRKTITLLDYDSTKDILASFSAKLRQAEISLDSFILLVKTTTHSKDFEKLAEIGIKNFIFKPVKPLQLLESIQISLTGRISLSNDSSQSTATVTDPEPSLSIQNENSEESSHVRDLRILVVDDSKDNQFLIQAYLSSLPYKLTFAENGKVALDIFKTHKFDLVLMDLQMPEMDGYTATQMIHAWEHNEGQTLTPVIAVSAHSYDANSEAFRKAQFFSYLVKPISPAQLRRTILEIDQNNSQERKFSGLRLRLNSLTKSDDTLEKQLADLAPQYFKNRVQDLKDIRKFLSLHQFDKIQTLAHRTKGNAKSYGFEDLGIIAGKLELAAQQKNLREIQTLIQEFDHVLLTSNQRSQYETISPSGDLRTL